MKIELLDFVIITSCFLGYFTSISLLTSPLYRNKANKFLSLSLFLISSILILGWYNAEQGFFEILQGIMWEFLFPVTLLSYFLIQLDHPFFKQKWYKWLYFPFFITLFINVFLDLDFVFKVYNTTFKEDSFIIELLYTLEELLSFLYSVSLILWSKFLIKNNNTISKEKKRWLLRLNLFFISVHIIWFIYVLEDFFLDLDYSLNLMWTLLSFLSWWILYYGIFKLQIIVQKDEIHEFITSQNIRVTKVEKKKINNASKFTKQLYILMEEEELYKNPLLSRLEIANQLKISESYLSSIIKQELNKNFIQFINEYRIEAAKLLLHNITFNKYSVEAIGMEAGFNSKSVFYSTFKTHLNMSPGMFRKLQKKS